MRNKHLHALLMLLLVAAACDKKKNESGGGATPPPPPPPVEKPAPRPSQGELPTLPRMDLPVDAQRDAKIALGHKLFFDKKLSVDGSRSCYSCHMNENGTGGAEPTAIGAGNKPLPRHSLSLWNVGYAKGAFYWDGRAKTLEEQAMGAWTGGNMGVAADRLPAKVAELARTYKAEFKAAFPDAKPDADEVVAAISEYERTLVCDDTAYDKFASGDKTALDDKQQRGLDVFLGKGMCTVCHTPPFFSVATNTDGGVYYNAGIGTDKPEADVDIGRMKVSKDAKDWAAFKPPSLRNVAKTAPYFHDGSAKTLEDAVHFMAGGGKANKNLTPLLADRKLTAEEFADLIAFLHALDCTGSLEEPK